MYKGFKFKLKPTEERELLNKHLGANRWLYNQLLDLKIRKYKRGINLSRFDLQSKLPLFKEKYLWLNENRFYLLTANS